MLWREAILYLAKKGCGTHNAHYAVPALPSLWVRTLLEAEASLKACRSECLEPRQIFRNLLALPKLASCNKRLACPGFSF